MTYFVFPPQFSQHDQRYKPIPSGGKVKAKAMATSSAGKEALFLIGK